MPACRQYLEEGAGGRGPVEPRRGRGEQQIVGQDFSQNRYLGEGLRAEEGVDWSKKNCWVGLTIGLKVLESGLLLGTQLSESFSPPMFHHELVYIE